MARLSQKTLDTYRDALELAHARYDAEAKPVIEEMTRYFRGDQWPTQTSAAVPGALPRITANLIFADVKVMIPVLALRDPRVFVKPTGATVQMPMPTRGLNGSMAPAMQPVQIVNGKPVAVLDVAKAKSALINWRWRELRMVKQVRRVITDALLAPFGIMKIGYEMASEKVDLPEGDSPAEMIEPNELISAEAPYAVRWSPTQFRVDPEARYPDLTDASWVAFGSLHRLEDVKRTERFKNTRELKATVQVKRDWPSGTARRITQTEAIGTDDDGLRVQLWECWNKRTNMRIVLADEHDKALEYVEWPQAIHGFPAETLCFTEHPDLVYGPPDLKQVLGQQDAYNRINAMVLNHTNRFVRKWVTTRGAFDEKELEKLQLPIDGLHIETDGNTKDAIMAVPDAPIPVDWWQTRANFREDHDRVSGIADFVRGVAEKVDTATEAAALQANLNVRTNDTRATVEDFAERVSRKLLDIDVQTINLPAAIPVITPEGAIALRDYVHVQDRETLLAHSEVEVEIGSMQPINEQTQKRDALELFTLLKNDPLVNQFKLRQLLVPAYREHVPDVESLFLTRDEFEALQQHAMQQAQGGPGGPPGAAPPGGPPRPPMAAPRPMPQAMAGGARARPTAPMMTGRPGSAAGSSGPRPVPGPTDQEV